MEIFINEKPANITLETEKTIGDVLTGIEQWILPTGNRIRGISLNGVNVAVEELGTVFEKELNSISRLDIALSSFRELAAEALVELTGVCSIFTDAPFEERAGIAESWGESPASLFLAQDMSDIYGLASGSFTGNGISPRNLVLLIEERLREIEDPGKETANSESLVIEISRRMEKLPLDMQTGKDAVAAETMQLFSQMGEKLFRLLNIFKSEGLSLDGFLIDELPARGFLDEFKTALIEISGAYKDQDTVLAGDIAEYELAPRILKFFNAIKTLKISNIQILP